MIFLIEIDNQYRSIVDLLMTINPYQGSREIDKVSVILDRFLLIPVTNYNQQQGEQGISCSQCFLTT